MCFNKKAAYRGCEADGGPVFLITTTMTETTAAAVVMAEGCWFISGHRAFMIWVAGQRSHDGSAEPCRDMKGYPTVPCMKATAGEQMVRCLSKQFGQLPKQWVDDQIYTSAYWENLVLVKGKNVCENRMRYFCLTTCPVQYMLRLNSSCCSVL